jgi:Condensation domain/Phosphopantetheine attachment site
MAEELYVLPSSLAQQRLWLLDQVLPDTSLYAMPTAIRLRGRLDAGALHAALTEVTARHEVLRTVLRLHGSEVVQVVTGAAEVELPVLDVGEDAGLALDRATALAQAPFDLGAGPLLRCALLRLRDDDHVLVLVLHHTIADGLSIQVLIRELTAVYTAVCTGAAQALEELPIQYADYAAWQRDQVTGGALEDQVGYWTRTLADVAALRLPADPACASPVPYSAVTAPVQVAAPVVRQLRLTAPGGAVTPFMVVLAGYAVVLSRWSGQREFAIGIPAGGRGEVALEPLIGLFVNTLAIRVEVDPEASFADLLAQVRERCLAAYSNADAPFDLLVDRIAPDRRAGQLPITQVWLNMARETPAVFDVGADLVATIMDLPSNATHHDVTLDLAEAQAGDAVHGVLVVRADKFSAATAALAATSLAAVLRSAAGSPSAPVASLSCPVGDVRPAAGEAQETAADGPPTGGGDAPASTYEHMLIRLWAETLERDDVGVSDEFYASGGNSLRAVRVVMGAREFGVELPLELMLGEHTIRQLATAARAASAEAVGQYG